MAKIDADLELPAMEIIRYNIAGQKIIKKYFDTVAHTRKTGKIARSVIIKEMAYWKRFDPVIVILALSIHLSRHAGKKEAYTRGIMRGLAVEGEMKKHGTIRKMGRNTPKRGEWDAEATSTGEDKPLPF